MLLDHATIDMKLLRTALVARWRWPEDVSSNELQLRPHADKRSSGARVGRHEAFDQTPNAAIKVVANAPDCRQALAGGIVHFLILVALPRINRTRVAAAHRDHQIGRIHELVREWFRKFLPQVKTKLSHYHDYRLVDLVCGCATRRAHVHSTVGV